MHDRGYNLDALTTTPANGSLMIEPVADYFLSLQEKICTTLEGLDQSATFSLEQIKPTTGGLSQPRVLADGQHIEKAAV